MKKAGGEINSLVQDHSQGEAELRSSSRLFASRSMLFAFPQLFPESWHSQQQLDGLQLWTANGNSLATQVWDLLGHNRVLSCPKQLWAEALQKQHFTKAWSRNRLVNSPTANSVRRADQGISAWEH